MGYCIHNQGMPGLSAVQQCDKGAGSAGYLTSLGTDTHH